jgi:hypothetical protein
VRSADVAGTVVALVLAVGVSAWAIAPPPTVASDVLATRVHDGWITLHGEPFTGIAIGTHDGGRIAERVEFVEGRKHGLTERWYGDGTQAFRATYRDGRRDGTVQSWWPDGTLRSQAHFDDGVADGIQREWYRSGALFKELKLADGRESGLQRAWRENGALYANYVAKDGRIFGLKRADLCFEITDGSGDDEDPSSVPPNVPTMGVSR